MMFSRFVRAYPPAPDAAAPAQSLWLPFRGEELLVCAGMLALVHDGADRILLARKPGWGRRYSILAGFVEPGESLEECVRREVYEEAGVLLTDLAYAGSQPWPYPSQLMIGFTARYAGG